MCPRRLVAGHEQSCRGGSALRQEPRTPQLEPDHKGAAGAAR